MTYLFHTKFRPISLHFTCRWKFKSKSGSLSTFGRELDFSVESFCDLLANVETESVARCIQSSAIAIFCFEKWR